MRLQNHDISAFVLRHIAGQMVPIIQRDTFLQA